MLFNGNRLVFRSLRCIDYFVYNSQRFIYENAPLPKAFNNFGVFSSKPRISKKPFGSVSDDVTKSGFDRHKLTTTNLKITKKQQTISQDDMMSTTAMLTK